MISPLSLIFTSTPGNGRPTVCSRTSSASCMALKALLSVWP